MLQTVARGTYFGSPGAGAEEGQPLRWRHRSSAARGEPSGSQRSRERRARIRHGCRAHAARRKRQMGEEVGSLSALRGARELSRYLAGGSQVGFSPMCCRIAIVEVNNEVIFRWGQPGKATARPQQQHTNTAAGDRSAETASA